MTAEAEVDEFKKEFEIMAAVRHPNIVFFYGVSTQPRLCMVMEYCARGSLYSCLRDVRPPSSLASERVSLFRHLLPSHTLRWGGRGCVGDGG